MLLQAGEQFAGHLHFNGESTDGGLMNGRPEASLQLCCSEITGNQFPVEYTDGRFKDTIARKQLRSTVAFWSGTIEENIS